MRDWPILATDLQQRGVAFVIVTVFATRGSTPRDAGARMIVTADETFGTIGGGQLEYQCTELAFRWLVSGTPVDACTRRYTLGANCGQCCGGVADILFEPFVIDQTDADQSEIGRDWLPVATDAWLAGSRAVLATVNWSKHEIGKHEIGKHGVGEHGNDGRGIGKYVIRPDCVSDAPRSVIDATHELLDSGELSVNKNLILPGNKPASVLLELLQSDRFEIALFGAGHVGTALVAVLAGLPCKLTWIDSRDVFPQTVPDYVSVVRVEQPHALVTHLRNDTFVLVMTHSHAEDLEICARVLKRDDIAYCGLIGSLSKRRQFERRLRKLGLTDEQIARLVCPIGLDGLTGKRPAEIAIAVAAQLLQRHEAVTAARLAPVRPAVQALQ